MVYKINDNIISGLGFSTEKNYNAVKNEISGLKKINNLFNLDGIFCVAEVDTNKLNYEFEKISNKPENFTKLEKMAILSVYNALITTNIDPAKEDVLFIFSTTKGNIDLLEKNNIFENDRIYLWKTAKIISEFFANKNEALVVSNACISGISAQITAYRNLVSKRFKYVIVVGADILSKFTVSGFNSFKALSTEICKPFDSDRCGLNIGETACTIIYGYTENQNELPKNTIVLENFGICNDANHISGPSRTAEGLNIAIQNTIQNIDIQQISFINTHGTATPYNDNMEAIAISRNNLNNIPLNSLKAYYGHTLGAAGILETIISAYALSDNKILVSKGFENLGVEAIVNVNKKLQSSEKPYFLKLISGFGGTNAAALFRKT